MPKPVKQKSREALKETEIAPLAHRMADAYWRALKADAEGRIGRLFHSRHDKQELLDARPDGIDWHELSYAEQVEPGAGFEVYEHIKQAARDGLESGQRAADVFESAFRPMVRARFLVLRESFIADWQPKGSMELRLIEMLAQIYCAYEFWMQMATQRAAVECEIETFKIKENGKWRSMSVNGNAEMQQAADMADKFNRLFLRTLRHRVTYSHRPASAMWRPHKRPQPCVKAGLCSAHTRTQRLYKTIVPPIC